MVIVFSLDGSSPAGVNFTLNFYKDNAAAKAAAAKKNKKFTAVVENGVVDFRGNPSAFAGAPPAKISKVELASIKRCVHDGAERSLEDGLALEAELMEKLFRSKDGSEGLHAFVEKRTPEFVGA